MSLLFLIFILQCYLWVRQRAQEKNRKLLEQELQNLKRELALLKGEPDSTNLRPSSFPDQPIFEGQKLNLTDFVPPKVSQTETAKPSPLSRKRFSLLTWWKDEWEMLVGGKLLNRIGAIALVLGIGFFLKFAFDHNWITMTVRVIIGMTVGALLLVLGAISRRKGLSIFAQGSVGAGIATMYLSVYAASNFYGLVTPVVAIIWMSGVTLLAFQQSLSYQSLATFWIGWLGGAFTPFLFPINVATPLGIYLYYTIFTVTILVTLWKKPTWISLYYAHVPITYIAYLVAGLGFHKFTLYDLSALVLIWAMFMIFEYQVQQNAGRWISIFSYLHPFFTLILTCFFIEKKELLALSIFGWGCLFTLPLLYGKWRKNYSEIPLLRRKVFQITFFLFLVFATIIQWYGSTCTILLGLEALLIAIWGLRFSRMHGWYFSFGLWCYTFLISFVNYFTASPMPLFWNLSFAPIAILIGSAMLIAWLGKKQYKPYLERIHIAWFFVWEVCFALDWFQNGNFAWIEFTNVDRVLLFAVVLAATSVWMYRFAVRKQYVSLQRFLCFSLLLVFFLVIFVTPIGHTFGISKAILNIRTLTFLLFGILLFWLGKIAATGTISKSHLLVQKLVPFLIVFLTFEWITVEIDQFFDVNKRLSAILPYYFGLAWGLVSFISMLWGKESKYIWTWRLSQGILFLAVFVVSLTALERSLLFPVINARFFAFLTLVTILGYLLWQKEKLAGVNFSIRKQYFYTFVLIFLMLEMISVETWTSIQYLLPSIDAISIKAYNLKQLALSLAWLLFAVALLVIGIWKKWKKIRLIALIIFGITICKIFLLDLSFLLAAYRIISFIVLGIILLATSFVYQKNKNWFID